MENKKEKIYKIIMLIFMTAIITFMVTSVGMYNYFTKSDDGTTEVLLKHIEISDATETIEERLEVVKKYLEKNYIGELDFENMTEMAIKGYVDGVNDQYTEYLTKSEYSDLLVNVKGDYVGIGIYMYENPDGAAVVLMPMEGSPAEEVGLQADDVIVSINGESCAEMDIDTVATKIKGKEGTTVEIEVLRGTETIKKVVERRTVEIKDSSSEILDGNIGYIQLTTFDEGCSDNILKYLSEFKAKNIKSVIIDLRDNTGGIVSEAISFSEIFIGEGKVIMRSYNKENSETITKSQNSQPVDFNVILLVNEYSASATEIVAAALKDNSAATIVGTTTYGKGVMQEIWPLFDGALKVTIEKFKTPNGDTINKTGITPDVIVEDDEMTTEDEQLQKAIELIKGEN